MTIMDRLLLIATDDGLVISDMAGRDWLKTLTGQQVTSVIAREGVILAGTASRGVLRSDNLGRSWREASAGLPSERINWLAFHPQISDMELAGLPAGIFISTDGAVSWQPLSSATCPWAGPLSAGVVHAVSVMEP